MLEPDPYAGLGCWDLRLGGVGYYSDFCGPLGQSVEYLRCGDIDIQPLPALRRNDRRLSVRDDQIGIAGSVLRLSAISSTRTRTSAASAGVVDTGIVVDRGTSTLVKPSHQAVRCPSASAYGKCAVDGILHVPSLADHRPRDLPRFLADLQGHAQRIGGCQAGSQAVTRRPPR